MRIFSASLLVEKKGKNLHLPTATWLTHGGLPPSNGSSSLPGSGVFKSFKLQLCLFSLLLSFPSKNLAAASLNTHHNACITNVVSSYSFRYHILASMANPGQRIFAQGQRRAGVVGPEVNAYFGSAYLGMQNYADEKIVSFTCLASKQSCLA